MSGTPLKAHPTSRPRGVPYASFTWQEALPRIKPYLPSELVSEETYTGLDAFVHDVPSIWHWGMFEARLGKEPAPVDILSAMAQLDETRLCLKKALLTTRHRGLDRARATLGSWAADDGSAFTRTPNLWLEWDQDGSDRPPLAWLCIAPHFFDKGLSAPTPTEIGALAEEFMATDPTLKVDGASEKLVELAELLPRDGQLMGFASLKPRGKPICRVFANLPRGGTFAWLQSIGWSGSWEELKNIAPLFVVEGEREWCQIEFDTRVGPHLALELAQTERRRPWQQSRQAWLDEVCRRGWASAEKAAAVMNWHGGEDCMLASGQQVRLLRSFHLKLVLAQGAPPLAKAYLGFYFRKKKPVRSSATFRRA